MSGGDAGPQQTMGGKPGEREEVMTDVEEGEERESEGEGEEGAKVRGDSQTSGEAVLEKVESGMKKN